MLFWISLIFIRIIKISQSRKENQTDHFKHFNYTRATIEFTLVQQIEDDFEKLNLCGFGYLSLYLLSLGPSDSIPILDLNSEYLELGFGRGGPLSAASRAKRMRTSFKHHQLRTMKSYFAINHNPDAKDLKQLSQKTGLPKRVLQVSKLFRFSLEGEGGGAYVLNICNKL